MAGLAGQPGTILVEAGAMLPGSVSLLPRPNETDWSRQTEMFEGLLIL
jgi:hypothetical protein